MTDDHTAGVHGHLWAIVPKPSVDTLDFVSTIAPDRLPDRLVALEAVHNFRDLGGYTTIDGRVTRWQTLYRADGLHRLTAADVEALRALGCTPSWTSGRTGSSTSGARSPWTPTR